MLGSPPIQWIPIPGGDSWARKSDGVIIHQAVNQWGAVALLNEFNALIKLVPTRTDGRGYLCCDVKIGGRYRTRKVHKLVMESFAGPTPKGYHIDHINGDKTNNTKINLRFRPDKENSADCRRGSRKGSVPLNKQQIEVAHMLIRKNWATKNIALAIGASETTIRRIRKKVG